MQGLEDAVVATVAQVKIVKHVTVADGAVSLDHVPIQVENL